MTTLVPPRAAPLTSRRPRRPSTPTGAVAVVGLGYVGLPTALAVGAAGIPAIGYDTSAARHDAIRAGAVDLSADDHVRLAALRKTPLLSLTAKANALAAADTVVICVPTPLDEYLVPDLRALRSACAAVVGQARPGQLLVLTSTTYVGCTADLLVGPLAARGLTVGEDVFVAFSPERIDPGRADHRQDTTPRVVGGVTAACAARAAAVLARISPSVHTVSSPEAAEMTKLLENTFRAVNIAFVNEMADACRELGLSVGEIIDAATTKPYGFMPFQPGPGVGGHCIPCDPHYLLWQLRARRAPMPVVDAAMTGIATRPRKIVDRVREALAERGSPLGGARVLVVGVAYKPGVADVRESPALEIMAELAGRGADVSFTDTHVERVRVGGRELTALTHPEAADADLVVVHTVHPSADHAWIGRHPHVLDATYRLDGVGHRLTP